MIPTEVVIAASGPQLWKVMGSQQSVPEDARHSRTPSPLPGDAPVHDNEGLDGLPRDIPPSTMPEAPMGFSDIPEQPIFASQQPEPAKKTRKKRKETRRSLDFGDNVNRDAQEEQVNDENQDLQAIARNLKTEPESPDALRKKKKKSRKAKARASEADESQQPPVQETQLESQILGNEPGHAMLQDIEAELQPPTEQSTTRKKRRKSQTDKGKPLELGDDPIAGSEEDDIIPSSAKGSGRRRSVPGSAADGARKFKQPGPISALNSEAIEDTLDPEPSADVVASTQDEDSFGYLGSNALVGESSFLAKQDVSSPLLARKDRREKSASRQASVAPDGLSQPQVKHHGSDTIPIAPMDLDPMDVDLFHPSQPSEQPQILGQEDEGDAMDDVTQFSQGAQATGNTSEDHDMTSEIDDETMLAMAATQEQPSTNGGHSTTRASSDQQDEQDEEQGQSTASSQTTQKAKQSAAARSRPRKAVQRKSPGPSNATEEDASDAAPASTVEGEAEQAEDEADIQRKFNAQFSSKTRGEEEQEEDKATESADGPTEDDLQPNTPTRVVPNPTQASGRVTRSYKKRQPKPTFYERDEQDNAEAFAELPPNEAADPPKKRARPKRRLPVDVPGEEGEASSSAPKPKRQRKAKKVKRDSGDEDNDGEGDTTLGGGLGDDQYLRGPLTPEEFASLDKVVEDFRKEHDMTQYQVNELLKQDPRDQFPDELWTRLTDACTTRKRQKIINVCRQRFHNFIARGRWTAEQDDELMEQIERHGQKWSVIGKEINRHQKDVRDRWRNYLVCRGKANESNWSTEEESRFLDIVLEALRIFDAERKANPDSDIFEKKTNEQLVDWGVVSERMGHSRTRLQCQEKWRRLRAADKLDDRFAAQLPDWIPYGASWRHEKACKELRQFTHDDKFKLVCAISEADVRSDAKIPWAKVEERMGLKGKIERVTPMIMWSRLRAAVPDQENKTTTACAEYLVEMYENEAGVLADLGNNELDPDMEQRMINDHVVAEEAKHEGGAPKRNRKDKKRFLPKSDAMILESDLGEDEPGENNEPSRANMNGGSPPSEDENPASQPTGEDAEMEDADQVSVDLADNSDLAALQQSNIDPRLQNQPDIYDPIAAHEDPVPARTKSKKSRKSGQLAAAAEINGQPSSSSKKSKKRKDLIDADATNSSPKASRKRMRIDSLISPPSPDKAVRKKAKKAQKAQKAMRPGEALIASQGYVSSDMEDMDDIPARLPIANLIN